MSGGGPAGPGERLVSAAYTLGWALIRWLPERFGRWVFALIAEIAWRRQGRSVRRLEANLSRVLGPSATGARLRAMSRAGMRSYLRYFYEVFRLPVMGRERILSGMHITGINQVHEHAAAGRGSVLALPHMGNWDHAGAWLVMSGVPFTTVMERLRPESLFERFVAFRRQIGMEVLPVGGGGQVFGTLAQRARAGGVLCLVADRDLGAGGIEVDFFGEKARFPAGPAALAVQTGAALHGAGLWFEGEEWHARVYDEIVPPAEGTRREKIQAMTQALAAVFETAIAEHPQDWHMLQRVFVADLEPGDPPAAP